MKKSLLIIIFGAVVAVFLVTQLIFNWPIVSLIENIFPDNGAPMGRQASRHYWEKDDPARYKTKIAIPFSHDYIIEVYKEEHVLQLIKEKKLIRENKTNVRNEFPDRLLENDGQTPEGIFKIWQMAVISDPAWPRFRHPWLARHSALHGQRTLGCPALSDADVIDLYNYILQNPNGGIGTLVIIQD